MYPFQNTKYYEGLSLVVYTDTTGHATAGYGHLMRKEDWAVVQDNKISQAQADEWYAEDIQTAEQGAEELIEDYAELPEIVQEILTDMCFNLGYYGLGSFHNFLQYIANNKYASAGTDLESSLWARQVGRRANDIIATLKQLGD